ncbi:DUF5994 family protein [Streptomyces sp. NPDC085927]|uniref:DUF5994 family protein n=1 Tax=Streptomyces sp. NPDC085927 TaxID=3365738 RepID=UPI0037D3F17B
MSRARPWRRRSRRVTNAGSRRPSGTGSHDGCHHSARWSTSSADEHTYRMPLPRLSLTPDAGHGRLDGAWWPRCGALELELPALVGSLDPGHGTVTRVTVGAAAWPDAPQTEAREFRESWTLWPVNLHADRDTSLPRGRVPRSERARGRAAISACGVATSGQMRRCRLQPGTFCSAEG